MAAMTTSRFATTTGSAGAAMRPGSDLFVPVDGVESVHLESLESRPPFLLALAGDSDAWLFVSSTGGLTAGRRDADGALFPYETVDRLHDSPAYSGPVTMIRGADAEGLPATWRPFASPPEAGSHRTLSRAVLGHRVTFEERSSGRELTFRYRWATSGTFGILRTCTLTNDSDAPRTLEILDGVRNVLPWGAPLALHQQTSCLVDAYKRSELVPGTSMVVYSLTAAVTDRAEAAEVLRANTVWSVGLPDAQVTPSSAVLDGFLRAGRTPGVPVLSGQRGHYLVQSRVRLEPGQSVTWHLVADVGLDHADVAALRDRLHAGALDAAILERDLKAAELRLRADLAAADGFQFTADRMASAHHLANVLYNNMRGGVFLRDHEIPRDELRGFLQLRNRPAAERQSGSVDALEDLVDVSELRKLAGRSGDADFERLTLECLPLHFGRRHGDPSRPWNRFRVSGRRKDGSPRLGYEGNWRDIFQNWEALGHSFPAFLPGFVAKFLNASTREGYNPYRISRDGIDWETPDPYDPWSHIGYWGDHQIVYLLRLLEALQRFSPATLDEMLDREIFSFGDVPYRLRSHDEMVRDPFETIDYDHDHAAAIEARVDRVGTDGRLAADADGNVLHVNLLEKLLIPVLTKLAAFVPDAGLWLNTQRPEWNDANNALAGKGASIVTTAALRRHLRFLAEWLGAAGDRELPVTRALRDWFTAQETFLTDRAESVVSSAADDAERRVWLDAGGRSFEAYRSAIRSDAADDRATLPLRAVADFARRAADVLDATLRRSRRADGLFHAYNVLEFGEGTVGVQSLAPMLEGQVAVLASGHLDPDEAAGLVDCMFRSDLYRPDQRSFMLYPRKDRPAFLDRNRVPQERWTGVGLLKRLADEGDESLLRIDGAGAGRFAGDFRTADDVGEALDRLAANPALADDVSRDRNAVLDLFRETFDHASFTGRSGTMYGYEGIGCIYWHMVAKLLLAVQELSLAADEAGSPSPELRDAYRRIRDGLGFRKTVDEYGAFPTDPYSHTPLHAGAQQPGMTGQVKEEILIRFAELGVQIREGEISFRPTLLNESEFFAQERSCVMLDPEGHPTSLEVPASGLVFGLCGVPVTYRRGAEENRVVMELKDGTAREWAGRTIDAEGSARVFARRGDVQRIRVDLAD